MGGIYKSLTIVGFLICAIFSYELLISSLIRKFFHFKPKYDNEFQKPKPNFKRKNSRSSSEKKKGFLTQTEYIQKSIDKKMGVQEIKDEIKEVLG